MRKIIGLGWKLNTYYKEELRRKILWTLWTLCRVNRNESVGVVQKKVGIVESDEVFKK